MKHLSKLAVLFSLFVVLESESCHKTKSPWVGECPFQNLDWMEVTDGYNSKTIIDLAAKIEAAAKADANAIKKIGDANANASFSSTLSKVVDKSSTIRTEVSKEFYEACSRQRIASCAIWKALKDGTLSSETARQQGEQLFIDIEKTFAQIKDDEEKKSPH